MDSYIISKSKVVMLGLSVVSLVVLFAGCKGDTGSAGAPGAPGSPGSFATSNCTDCHHLNTLTETPNSLIFIDGLAGGDKVVSVGTPTTLTAVVSKLPAGEVPISYLWTQFGGLLATITQVVSNPAATVTLTTPASKTTLVSSLNLPDRTIVAPVTNLAVEEAGNAELQLVVSTASGKSYYDLVLVKDSNADAALAPIAVVNGGLNTVPINLPVLLQSKVSVTGYDWSLTPAPSSSATLTDGTTQFPYFKPDVVGQYVLTDSVSGATVTVFAGTWRGEITGFDGTNVIPDTTCTDCHSSTGGAIDKFTPWKATGHSHIFTKNLNNGGHYGPGCFQCHTVGFNTAAANNGFDDQANYSTFIADTSMFASASDPTRYSRMWSSPTYSALAKETNIQCENCHGPQVGTGSLGFVESHMSTTDSSTGGPRTSMAADVCGACHGEPQRHGRFQQWQQSGHGQYDLAAEEGTPEGNPSAQNCAGCHTAQGFLIYLSQLQAGIPLRSIPSGSVTWTADTVHPVTCQVCHDPHAEGASSGVPNTATVRVTDNTPKLPGGFIATGVGRGAMCIVCHNSRNGVPTSGPFNIAPYNKDSFLHQDGDPVWGSLTSYSGPHEACQGDVLMGYNAYFVGNGIMRSPHSLIVDTCANCHMVQTPPPPLLSYNLSGTNHTFTASLDICGNCHGVNQGLAPMLQNSVKAGLDTLQASIANVIITRNTGTPIAQVVDLGSRGTVNVLFEGDTTPTAIGVGSIPGLDIPTLGTDALAKGLWNYYLIKQDVSLGVHNPDFTFLVLGESKFQVDSIKEP